MKSLSSRLVRSAKLSLKSIGQSLSQKCFKEKSFALTGIPYGLISLDQEATYRQDDTAVSCPLPKTVQPYKHPAFTPFHAGPFAQGVVTIPNGLSTHFGGNLTENGKLVTTFLIPIDGKKHHQHELFNFQLSRIKPRILKVDAPVISLTAGWQGAFYHWMYQILPRLDIMQDVEHKIYIDQSHPFQRRCMKLMGLHDRVIASNLHHVVQATELIVPEGPMNPSFASCRFLREAFLPHIHKLPKRRLYISRNDAKTRRIVNEAELLPILDAFGFTITSLSDATMEEQIAQVASAEMIVAPHGAGLAHLVFADPGTPVLELFHRAYFNPCYWHLAATCTHPYHVLFDTRETDEGDPDIWVDPTELRLTLEAMERDRPH